MPVYIGTKRTLLNSPREGVGVSFDPLTLFANGENGILMPATFLERQFADIYAQMPVIADGNAVGLSLEASKWDGGSLAAMLAAQPELSPSTDFSSGWTLSGTGYSVGGGQATAAAGSGGGGWFKSVAGLMDKKFLWSSFIVSGFVAGQVGARNGTNTVVTFTSNGAKTAVSSSLNHNLINWAGLDASNTFNISAASVKELIGNHGAQATGNFKPLYRTAESGHWLFDGLDDNWLTTLLLGSAGMLAFDGTYTGTSDVSIGTQGASNGRGYIGIDASGYAAAGIGADGMSTIVGNVDIRNTRVLHLVKWDGSQVVMKVNNATIYTGALNGAPNTTIPLRIGALNNNGTAASFLAGKAKMFYALDRFTTDAEDTGLFNSRIT